MMHTRTIITNTHPWNIIRPQFICYRGYPHNLNYFGMTTDGLRPHLTNVSPPMHYQTSLEIRATPVEKMTVVETSMWIWTLACRNLWLERDIYRAKFFRWNINGLKL